MGIDTRHPISSNDTDTEDRLLLPENYRRGENGRSGNSDKDAMGVVEGIRGNTLVDTGTSVNERVIGSCQDIKNNAVIKFVYNPSQDVTFISASVNTTNPLVVSIAGNTIPIPIGTIITINQGGNIFSGKVASIIGTSYTLTLVSGTPTLAAITIISILNYHFIKRYFSATGLSEYLSNPALMGPVLNFQSTDRIYNPRVIEAGFTQLLTFVTCPDGVPRIMDINKMKIGGIYYGIANDDQYINIAKQPPSEAPSLAYGYSLNNKVNIIATTYFQFRYRYIYDDYQIGSCSPISLISRNQSTDNYIQVTVNSGHHTVKFVQICFRVGNGSSDTGENNPEWYIFNTVEKSKEGWADDADNSVLFFGDELKLSISRIDTDVNFYSVPQRAEHIEFVSQNQIILGSITEGYDNV